MRIVRLHSLLASALMLGISLAVSPQAFAQGTESEPNASCAEAQHLGALALPFLLQGSLTTPPDTPDVDFYRFTATPGSLVVLELDGADAGAGTLPDPYLGFFQVYGDSCFVNHTNDDLVGRNAGLTITVPSSGEVVVAATSYGDWEFQGTGGYAGTYRLTVREVPVAQAVQGRVVDAVNGQPVPYAIVALLTCDEAGSCSNYAGSTGVDATGSFRFENGSYNVYGPLLAGSYQIIVESLGYESRIESIFELAASQELNIGDIGLQKVPALGSVSGRLVDEISGRVLTGNGAPNAWVELQYCGVWGCNGRETQSVRPDGTFRFEGSTWNPLPPGTYQIVAGADQYQDTFSQTFEVANGQHFTFGDFRVKSMPARINLVENCVIPPTGGTCQVTMRVTNGATTRLQGEAWGMVEASWTGSPAQRTEFQVGSPKALNLAPGQSVVLPLTFEVPGNVNDGSYVCVTGFAAQRPHEFNTLGAHPLACFIKGVGGFLQVPENKKRDAVLRARGQAGPTQP